MTSRSKISSKRKQSETLSAPEVNSDVDDAAPDVVGRAGLGLSMFKQMVNEPCPISTHAGGGGNTCSIEGVVLRGAKTKSGSADKWHVTIAVTKILSHGCKDIVTTGVEGIAFSLPVKYLEASPEEKAKDKHAKGPFVIDIDKNLKANFLGLITTTFYITDGKLEAKWLGGTPCPPVENCTAGTKVLVTGVTSTYGKDQFTSPDSAFGGKLFINAKKMIPILSEVGPGEVAAAIINEARSATVQASAAFLWSMAMRGFFGLTYNEPCHQQQADACKAKWTQLVSGSSAKCESIALSLAGDDANKAAMEALKAHCSRIKDVTAEDAAGGAPIFLSDFDHKDCTTAYYAPLVQYNISPGNLDPDFGSAIFDPARRDSVPNSFVEAQVSNIEFKGNLVSVDYRLFFLFDKAAAITVTDERMPILHSGKAAASIKLTKRKVGPEMVGSLVDHKIVTSIKEIMPFANQAIYASVFPRGADDGQLSAHFAATSGIDFIDGIKKAAIQVSESWLDQTMLDSTGVFIYEKPDGVAFIEPQDKCGPMPTLKNAGYQALSEGSFSIKNLKVPTGKDKAYFVVYDGASENIRTNPDLSTSVDAGEAHIADIAAALRDDADCKEFLLNNAIVYVVIA
jgi:hypothetical protein